MTEIMPPQAMIQAEEGEQSGGRTGSTLLVIAGAVMVAAALIMLAVQMKSYNAARQYLPPGFTLGEIPSGGLTDDQARTLLQETYSAPVMVRYDGQEYTLNPSEVGFEVDTDAVLAAARADSSSAEYWTGLWRFLWNRPAAGASLPIQATYSEDALRAWIANLAAQHDHPPQPADIVLETLSFRPGSPGETLDQEAAASLLGEALVRPSHRVVELTPTPVDAPQPDMETLKSLIVAYLQANQFRGVMSVYVIDQQTGDELNLDVDLRQGTPTYLSCDIAYAGLSTMKLTILTEWYRYYLGWEPLPYEQDTIDKVVVYSSNWHANSMLADIGDGDPYLGAQRVTESMKYLGLENSFIVAPYDDETPPAYYTTPALEAARSESCINTLPDPYMQTTPRDLSLLLDMIYQCAEWGGGGLIAAYPEDITQAECQAMIDVLSRNVEGKLIRAGVPAGTEVAHKHGYGLSDTMSDAGLVFSPGGDYVIVMFLWEETDWLNAYETFPLMRDVSAATFNYFNPDLIYEPRMTIDEMFDARQ